MHGRPTTQSHEPAHDSDPRRWHILGVLVLALLVTSIDHTIINVAMPRLVSDLGASAAQLQWIVASYTIVFAGLLLTAGSLGDRFGRRRALIAGLTGFLTGSVIAATAGSTAMLIAGRCVMGAGGALIMNPIRTPGPRRHAVGHTSPTRIGWRQLASVRPKRLPRRVPLDARPMRCGRHTSSRLGSAPNP